MSRHQPTVALFFPQVCRGGEHEWMSVLVREVGRDAILRLAFALDPLRLGAFAHVWRARIGGDLNDDHVRLARRGWRKRCTTNGLPVRHLGPVAQARCGNITSLANLLQANIGNAYSFASV